MRKINKKDETTTYQIIVNKNIVIEEITMNWLKPSTWGKEEIIKIPTGRKPVGIFVISVAIISFFRYTISAF